MCGDEDKPDASTVYSYFSNTSISTVVGPLMKLCCHDHLKRLRTEAQIREGHRKKLPV